MKRHYDLDGSGNVLGSFARPQLGVTLELLEEPGFDQRLARWTGSVWEFQLDDRKAEVSNMLMGFSAQILALSDLIVHDWEEQGLSGDYTQIEYDAEVAKRVTLRSALTTKFADIKAAATPEALDSIEATLGVLYTNQLEIYAADRLAKAP